MLKLRFFWDNFGVGVFVDLNRILSIVKFRDIYAVILGEGSGLFQFQKFLNILPLENDVFTSNKGLAY